MNVLVVDDSWAMRRYVLRQLKSAGLAIENLFEAENGEQALAALDQAPLDFIAAGVSRPEMGGAEFVRWVQAHPKHGRIPLVAIAPEPDATQVEDLRERGAVGFLAKPFSAGAILAEWRRLTGG